MNEPIIIRPIFGRYRLRYEGRKGLQAGLGAFLTEGFFAMPHPPMAERCDQE
jgi:hypothetical protein